MFTPRNYDSGKLVSMLQVASANTVAKGDALAFSSGYVQRATGTTTEVRYVAMQDQTTAGTALTLLCLETAGVAFEADCTHNMAQSYVGTKVDLTDHGTLDNDSASTDYTFFIENIIGATTDKKCVGYFVQKTS